MWPWTATTEGEIYIFCFHRPLGNLANPRAQAKHYCGFAEDFDARMAKQLAGKGAKLVAAAMAQGIPYDVFHWPACLAVEKLLKKSHRLSLYCPRCCAAAGRTVKPLPVVATQLELPLFVPDDFPEPQPLRMDWQEMSTLRSWRAARLAVLPVGNLDDDLL